MRKTWFFKSRSKEEEPLQVYLKLHLPMKFLQVSCLLFAFFSLSFGISRIPIETARVPLNFEIDQQILDSGGMCRNKALEGIITKDAFNVRTTYKKKVNNQGEQRLIDQNQAVVEQSLLRDNKRTSRVTATVDGGFTAELHAKVHFERVTVEVRTTDRRHELIYRIEFTRMDRAEGVLENKVELPLCYNLGEPTIIKPQPITKNLNVSGGACAKDTPLKGTVTYEANNFNFQVQVANPADKKTLEDHFTEQLKQTLIDRNTKTQEVMALVDKGFKAELHAQIGLEHVIIKGLSVGTGKHLFTVSFTRMANATGVLKNKEELTCPNPNPDGSTTSPS